MNGRHEFVFQGMPAAAAVCLYIAITLVLAVLGLQRTGGTFVYAQDDPYIHLTLARTLAEHGVWGIRPTEFASASSSPLWTVLLAASWKLGVRVVWWPLLVNVVAGVGLIAVIDRLLAPHLNAARRAMALAVIVLAAPLPTLALIGLEHTLQVLLVLGFVWAVARIVAGDAAASAPQACLLAALLVATRYEGLFVVAAAGLVLLQRRRTATAVAIGVAASAPVLVAGLYFSAHGAPFLPNSVLMKSLPGRFATVGTGIAALLGDWMSVASLFSRPAELALTIVVLLVLAISWNPPDRWRRSMSIGFIFIVTVLCHAAFVKLAWFFRYEAYLVVLGLVALTMLATDPDVSARLRTFMSGNVAAAVLLGLLAFPLATRALSALVMTPLAMQSVFDQQYQMAMFFRGAYPDDAVALNDIGAVGWYSSSRLVDVYGLATQEVADAKRRGPWNASVLESIAARRGVRAVAMYERVFAPIIPRPWTLVGEWTMPHNVGVSEETVGFFAPRSEDVSRLRAALDAYSQKLPGQVQYRVR
jgi:hypothetical protein